MLAAADADQATLAGRLQELRDQRDRLVEFWDAYSADQLDAAQARFNSTLRWLAILGAFALPGTLLLVALSLAALGRPAAHGGRHLRFGARALATPHRHRRP